MVKQHENAQLLTACGRVSANFSSTNFQVANHGSPAVTVHDAVPDWQASKLILLLFWAGHSGISPKCLPVRCKDPKARLPICVTDSGISWVAVKELKLSYYIRDTLLFSIYTHYGNLT